MLESLSIRNFALIDRLEIDFTDGFNVITGETGAGKSIILGALGLILGNNADSSAVRTGESECTVSAVFSIPDGHPVNAFLRERGLEPEEGLVHVRRVVRSGGTRGLISVQGQSVSRSELAEITGALIDMHSQHEHQSLVHSDRQRRIVDSYAGNSGILTGYRNAFDNWRMLVDRRSELAQSVEKAMREKDYLAFTLAEIRRVDPKEGEDDSLKEEITLLSNYESLSGNLSQAQAALSAAKDQLFDAEACVSRAEKTDAQLSELSRRTSVLRIEAADLYETLRDRFNSLSFSQEKLDRLQERQSAIRRLSKYGKTIPEILSYAERTERALSQCENSEEELKNIEKEIEAAQFEVDRTAKALSASRLKAAEALQKEVTSVLRELGMPSAQFTIGISPVAPAVNGADEVRFVIAPNRGEEPRALSQIASGGELSRIMLAIKTVLASEDEVLTQVFDEVDAGIGGAVAQAVARQLASLGRNVQVIAITHLASIASAARTQFVVSKSETGGRTVSSIARVEGEERVREIARMLSGDSSRVSIEHAGSMLGLGSGTVD